MGWFRRDEQRTLTVLPAALSYLPLDGTITASTAPLNPDVFACVRVLTDAAASCPLITYRRASDNERRRASGRTAELLRAPSEGTTQAGFVATTLAHLLLWGNAYIGKFRDSEGRVEQLLPLDPSQVQVERRQGRIVFTVTIDGRTSEHGLDDIVHVKGLSTDGLIGFAPIRAMYATLDLNAATRTAATGLFKNNARPSGIVQTTRKLTEDQAVALKAQWSGRHAGESAGGIAVMAGELSFIPIAMPADDAQLVESRKLSATEVARVFRVPPWMVGASDDNSLTYSNTEQQSLSFAMYSLRPWLVQVEQALTADRDLFGPSLFCEFLLDALLRADSWTRAQVYEKALDPITGWMRRDEVRRLENLEAEPPVVRLQNFATESTNGQGVIAS